MVSALTVSENAHQINLQHKRAAFRANRHIWGVQAKTQLKSALFQPAEDPTRVDFARIDGFINLRQLRHDAPLTISRGHVVDDDGTVRQPTCQALDPQSEITHVAPLLREFCSDPLPRFRVVRDKVAVIHSELISKGVGNKGAITCITGDVGYGVAPRYRGQHDRVGAHTAIVRIPCEVLVLDLLVREGTFGAIMPVGVIYVGQLSDSYVPAEPPTRDLLPLREPVVHLGKGPSVLHTPDVPRYAEMAQYAFDRLGWDGERFDVYRYRMEYPVMRSAVVVRFDLPERPDG